MLRPLSDTLARLRSLFARQPSSPTPGWRWWQPSTASGADDAPRDGLRQALNLALSVAQLGAATLIFSSPFGDELFSSAASPNPPIVPADYTFGIWAFIFPASIAYGIYQALPAQRSNDLLRRIGFRTAFAFGCITLWSVVTLIDPLRLTVPLFFGALWGLASALYRSSRHERPLSRAERLFIVVPLGVYAAWCTVGTVANTSTSLVGLGYGELVLGERAWAIMMLLAAGALSALTTVATRGSIPYAAGIIWALAGIVVANGGEPARRSVAITAAGMALAVGAALLAARARAATRPREA